MERNWSQHCASKEQLDFFDEWGYLVIDDALSEDQVEKMTMAIDRVDAAERAVHGLKPHQTMAKFRTIVEDGLFLDLPDNNKVFPLAWDILGWNIQHYISHLIVYPPEAERSEVNLGSWHQDGGRLVREMERPHLRGVNTSGVTRKVIFIGSMRSDSSAANRRWGRREGLVATDRCRCAPQDVDRDASW